MPITSTLNEWRASVTLLGSLAAVLAVLAISLGTGSFEWPVDPLIVLAIVVVAAAVGATLSVVLSNENGAWDAAE